MQRKNQRKELLQIIKHFGQFQINVDTKTKYVEYNFDEKSTQEHPTNNNIQEDIKRQKISCDGRKISSKAG